MKEIIKLAFTLICCFAIATSALAGTAKCQQKQQAEKPEKQSEQTQPSATQTNKSSVSFGTIPVFSLLLSPTINALKNAKTIFNFIEEEDNSKTSHNCKVNKLVS